MYYSFQEVLELTKKSRSQLSFLISNGILRPVNPNTWRADGGYRFKKEDIDTYIENQISQQESLLTLSEAAKYVGRSKSFIQQSVEKGILPYEEVQKRKRKVRLYNRKELDKIKVSLSENVRKSAGITIYKDGLVLFDIVNLNNEKVRVIDVQDRKGITEKNTYITIPPHIESDAISNKPYFTAPGTVTFIFPIVENFHNNVLDTISYLIKHIGIANLKLWKIDHDYKVQIRLVSIPFNDSVLRMLMSFITEGEVLHKKHTISFTTGKKKLTIQLSKSLYNQIDRDKDRGNFNTPSDVVEHILTEHYEGRKDK